jgi:hypothetical protein
MTQGFKFTIKKVSTVMQIAMMARIKKEATM